MNKKQMLVAVGLTLLGAIAIGCGSSDAADSVKVPTAQPNATEKQRIKPVKGSTNGTAGSAATPISQ